MIIQPNAEPDRDRDAPELVVGQILAVGGIGIAPTFSADTFAPCMAAIQVDTPPAAGPGTIAFADGNHEARYRLANKPDAAIKLGPDLDA